MARLQTMRPRVATLQARAAPAPKVARAFYLTPAWRAARELALALGNHQCAHCGRRACVLYVDHIRELTDGGAPFEQSNLEPLCGACHTRKTGRARIDRNRTPATGALGIDAPATPAASNPGQTISTDACADGSAPAAPGKAGAPRR